ncbi:hypothetical protein ONZ45_g8893 [Pleurotus djamor]|nr:hypothetical protein ONZ45_g8893 [Pleurotus djamor]
MSIVSSGVTDLSTEQTAYGALLASQNAIAALAFLIWDICITMDEEVALIWSQPLSFINAVYFVVRYLPFLLQATTLPIGSTRPAGVTYSYHACYIWQLYQLIATMFMFMSVEYVLLLRVEALYKENKVVITVLRLLYFVEIVCMNVGIGLTMPGFKFDDRCTNIVTPNTSIVFGVVTPIFQTLLFVLTSIKFTQAVKQGWGRIPLAELIMRDGAWAFLLIEVLLGGNGVLYLGVPYPYTSLLFR